MIQHVSYGWPTRGRLRRREQERERERDEVNEDESGVQQTHARRAGCRM